MTPDELNAEHNFRYQERLALLGFTDRSQDVPGWARAIAWTEANAAIEALTKQETASHPYHELH